MKTKFFVLGMLALLFGIISAGCDNGNNSTSSPPVEIGSLADLMAIDDSAANMSRDYILTADIVLDNGGPVTTPIGSVSENMTVFTGDFDGNGHTIEVQITSGLTTFEGVFPGTYAGLFAGLGSGGSVHDLKVSGTVTITNFDNDLAVGAGGVAGGMFPGTSISNVTSSVAVTATSSGDDNVYVGGIVGLSQGTVSNVRASGNISANGSDNLHAGGVVGSAQGTLRNVSATGNVSVNGNGDVYAGGVVGTSEGTVSNVYATGDISAITSVDEDAYAGGIAGTAGGTISYAYATGSVSAGGTALTAMATDITLGAGGIAGAATGAVVRYTVALNSAVSASDDSASIPYNKCSYRIASTATGDVTTNGAANYGRSDLSPTGGDYLVDKGAAGQDGVDVTVTGGPPAAYTAPLESWWRNTGFSGADWTNVWDWDSTSGLPKLR